MPNTRLPDAHYRRLAPGEATPTPDEWLELDTRPPLPAGASGSAGVSPDNDLAIDGVAAPLTSSGSGA